MNLKSAKDIERNSDAIFCHKCLEYREVLRFSAGRKQHITFSLECGHRRVFQWDTLTWTISTEF